ncbi:hypothetical protein IWQ56_004822, partial [Coemansia nantahalensis]
PCRWRWQARQAAAAGARQRGGGKQAHARHVWPQAGGAAPARARGGRRRRGEHGRRLDGGDATYCL